MPYITSVERLGYERGRAEGRRQGLISRIELGLALKFGADGLRLLPDIYKIQDLDVLQAVHEALKVVSSPDELRRVYRRE